MTYYRETFPQTIMGPGFKYRLRLESPRCERLSAEMARIYSGADLEPDNRVKLLKLHQALHRAYYAVQFDKMFANVACPPRDGIAKFKVVERDFREFEQQIGASEGVI
ncbi:MAG: hypothetical protein ACOH2T_29380 [Pseudomonas sp.]